MFRKLLRLLFGHTWSAPDPPAAPSSSSAAAPIPERVSEEQRPTDPVAPSNGMTTNDDDGSPADSISTNPTREDVRATAAARREERRRAAAERHRTDIRFLGRGVSRDLQKRHSDTDRLTQLGLPLLSTPAELAQAVRLPIPRLRWLAWHSECITRSHYYSFKIPRKDGRPRTLQAPHRTLACVQGWILDEVLYQIPVHAAAHGFVPERSVVTNARPHLGAAVVVNVDLKDFFPSITFPRVNGLFRSFGYSPAVATILALLCTESPREPRLNDGQRCLVACGPRALPQGACTSPTISNLITRSLDCRLQALADRLGWTYTRYADDITWSTRSTPTPSIGYVLARIRHIVQDEGFRLQPQKTRILRRHQRQAVTGLAVNDCLSVPRTVVRRVRAILHNAQFTGLEAQNREQHPHFEDWLLGMIGWIQMVQPETGDKLRGRFDQLRTG